MGIFSESDIPEVEFGEDPPLLEELLDRQRSAALSDLKLLDDELIRISDRVFYYDETVTPQLLESIQLRVRHVMKVLA